MLKQPVGQPQPFRSQPSQVFRPAPPSPEPPPPPPPRRRLPLRSVVLLLAATGMIAAAAFVVTRGQPNGQPASDATNPTGATGATDGSGSAAGAGGGPAGQNPPPGQVTGSFATTLKSGRLSLEVVVVPAAPQGPNQLHLTGLVPDGHLADIQDLVVRLHPPDGGRPLTPVMERLGSNHLLATAVPLPTPGEWQLELSMRVRETDADKTRTLAPFREVQLQTPIPIG